MKAINDKMMLLELSHKYDPAQDISGFIPRCYGVYVWYNKDNDVIEYIGKATGNKGLYQRIIRQHLN